MGQKKIIIREFPSKIHFLKKVMHFHFITDSYVFRFRNSLINCHSQERKTMSVADTQKSPNKAEAIKVKSKRKVRQTDLLFRRLSYTRPGPY